MHQYKKAPNTGILLLSGLFLCLTWKSIRFMVC